MNVIMTCASFNLYALVLVTGATKEVISHFPEGRIPEDRSWSRSLHLADPRPAHAQVSERIDKVILLAGHLLRVLQMMLHQWQGPDQVRASFKEIDSWA